MTIKFVAGHSYYGRSIGDADQIITIEVLSRTAQTIQAKTDRGLKKLRVKEHDGVEQVLPWGNYSMSPSVRADREVTPALKPAHVSAAVKTHREQIRAAMLELAQNPVRH